MLHTHLSIGGTPQAIYRLPTGHLLCPWPKCLKPCLHLGNLKEHIMIHLNIKPYKCPHCDYSARKKFNLKKHVMQNHLAKM